MKKRVLLVEDESVTQRFVIKVLESHYEIECCKTIADGLRAIESTTFDLIILDRMLPDGDGLRICSELQSQKSNIPIVIISGKNEESDYVAGFYAGAVDCISKPLRPLELKARIDARVKLSNEILMSETLSVNPRTSRAHVVRNGQSQELNLTQTEMKLLILFLKANEAILSREQILNRIWRHNLNVSDRTVDAHISHLRKKLVGTDIRISSVLGEGYRLEFAKKTKVA